MTSPSPVREGDEWLEVDGRGGYASGTATGVRTRRYHALLLVATTPPTGRVVLVNGFDAWVDVEGDRIPLTTQTYLGGARHPDGTSALHSFTPDPWPSWRYRLPGGDELLHELLVRQGRPELILRWSLSSDRGGVRLFVRPFLSGRDMHALHHENEAFRFHASVEEEGTPAEVRVVWRPYPVHPAIISRCNGTYDHDPLWYRGFFYQEERARGMEHAEDLGSPGVFEWDLSAEAIWTLAADIGATPEAADETAGMSRPSSIGKPLGEAVHDALGEERARRAAFPTRLHRAADAYIVRRGQSATVIAGYPWFADWGRDTFIALRGLCLAAGRLSEARSILLGWSREISDGMLPNRFVEEGDEPEFNSVDAALWFVAAAAEYLRREELEGHRGEGVRRELEGAVEAILEGHESGTRHGIRVDSDGLLAAGEPGVQLTWMDAKVGDWVVTPRIGKPVEVQALWIHALGIGSRIAPMRWAKLAARARESFAERFWNASTGCLMDVVDVDHVPGTADPSIRPNQIFAVGGLPTVLLDAERSRSVVERVESSLWTPLGLRSLAPDDPSYRPRYEGDAVQRDGAYHEGTVWPWLLGPFVEAWVHVRGGGSDARAEARARFLAPLLEHLDEAGLGHVSEIADAEPPHTPRGCPFQAWSVGEALRLAAVLLAPTDGDSREGALDVGKEHLRDRRAVRP